MKIYKATDRLSVKIGELVFKLAPLEVLHKNEIALAQKDGPLMPIFYAMKYSLKGIEPGLKDSLGEPTELEFDADGNLTDSCLNWIFNSEESEAVQKLQLVCVALINGIPKQIVYPDTKKPIEGVKILNPTKGKSKKSSSR